MLKMQCPLSRGAITPEQCLGNNSLSVKRNEMCRSVGCASEYLACLQCVLHRTVDSDSLKLDGQRKYCLAHHSEGRLDFHKPANALRPIVFLEKVMSEKTKLAGVLEDVATVKGWLEKYPDQIRKIMGETGFTRERVQGYRRFLRLSKNVQAAVREEKLTFHQSLNLSIFSHKVQDEILKECLKNGFNNLSSEIKKRKGKVQEEIFSQNEYLKELFFGLDWVSQKFGEAVYIARMDGGYTYQSLAKDFKRCFTWVRRQESLRLLKPECFEYFKQERLSINQLYDIAKSPDQDLALTFHLNREKFH